MKLPINKGIIHIPLAIIAIGAITLGLFSASKVPQYLEDREHKKLSQETSIPEGSASSDEILIGFKSDVSNSQKDNSHRQNNASVNKRIDAINTDAVNIPAGSTVQEALERYKNIPGVEYAEPNYLATAFLTPNDTFYNKQWNLQKIFSDASYDVSQGGFGPIAIVDTGVDAGHPDLAGLVLTGFSTLNDSSNAHDDNGHGTHVAGIASAQTNNSNGIASTSFASTILPVKVLDANGMGTYEDVAEGIVYAADNNARIVNLSLGGSSSSRTMERAVSYALAKGSIIVAAAGNTGNNSPVYPAAYSGVLAVTASDKSDNLASFSSYGSNTFTASPGVAITSSLPGGGYGDSSGTSMAAPHLAGLIALTLASNPEISNSDVIAQIKDNAEKVGPFAYDENGWNPYFGYGRINSGKTLQAVSETEEEELLEPTPTPSNEASPSGTRETKKSGAYSFAFSLTGTIESVDLTLNKMTIKVDGGTPNIMENITGNLVEVYYDTSTNIKYQYKDLTPEEVPTGSKINTKGNIDQNKLMATEMIVKNIQTTGNQNNPSQAQPNQNQETNTGSDSVTNDSNKEPAPQNNNSSVQKELPEPALNRGNRVRGISTEQSSWNIFIDKLINLLTN